MSFYQFPFQGLNRHSLDLALLDSFKHGVSDILIESDEPVFVKHLGKTTSATSFPVPGEITEVLIGQIYQESGLGQIAAGKYLKFPYEVLDETDDSIVRFRTTVTGILPAKGRTGFEIAFRPFPSVAPSVADLGIPPEIVNAYNRKFGLFLMTGPTGSGKSTYMASLLTDAVQHRRENIITYEDPCEFDFHYVPNRLSKISQTEIPTHLLDFEQTIPNALRRSPEKIFFGEVRTKGIFRYLVDIALTGHMVSTTLHTNSVALAIPRMIEGYSVDDQREMASRTLQAIQGIVHQKLVNNINNTGRTAITSHLVFTEAMRENLLKNLGDIHLLGQAIDKYVNECGLPIETSLLNSFSQGRVSLNEYLDLCDSIGMNPNSTLIKRVADEQRDLNVLDDEQYKHWMSFIL